MNGFRKEVVVKMDLPDLFRGKWAWVMGPVVVLLVLGFGYWTSTHGYESKHVQYNGGFSSSTSGASSSENGVYALKGQTIVVDYNVKQLARGRFRVFIRRAWGSANSGEDVSRFIDTTGPGSVELVAGEIGRYNISCGGSANGDGYDVTYTASWKVR